VNVLTLLLSSICQVQSLDHLVVLEKPGAVEAEKGMIPTENMMPDEGKDTAQAPDGI
jgi:hypothetical protein